VGRPKAADGNQDGFLIFGPINTRSRRREKICARFSDDYWLVKDRDGEFPHDFHRVFAEAGWLGVCMRKIMAGQGSASPKPR